MGDTNYISSLVKILEDPIETVFKTNIPITQFRVQLPQARNKNIVNLVFWGKLGQDIKQYYRVNDYIIIEGYVSDKKTLKFSKKMEITVLRVYPFLLNHNLSMK